MSWGIIGATAISTGANYLSDKASGQETSSAGGPTSQDIQNARKLFTKYGDYAQRGLFHIGKITPENRRRTANKLFQLQSAGEPMRQAALRGGYSNAQARLRGTDAKLQNIFFGTPGGEGYLDKRGIDVNLDNLKNLRPGELRGIPKLAPPRESSAILSSKKEQPRNELTKEQLESILKVTLGGFL